MVECTVSKAGVSGSSPTVGRSFGAYWRVFQAKLMRNLLKQVAEPGIEPGTSGATAGCSTTEPLGPMDNGIIIRIYEWVYHS